MADVTRITQVLDQFLNDNWSLTPIQWENVDSRIPRRVTYIDTMVNIHYSENASIGNKHTRHNGEYLIRVFSPLNSGSIDAKEKADALINLLQNKPFPDTIFTYAGSVKTIGDGGYGLYQVNVRIPFTADQQDI